MASKEEYETPPEASDTDKRILAFRKEIEDRIKVVKTLWMLNPSLGKLPRKLENPFLYRLVYCILDTRYEENGFGDCVYVPTPYFTWRCRILHRVKELEKFTEESIKEDGNTPPTSDMAKTLNLFARQMKAPGAKTIQLKHDGECSDLEIQDDDDDSDDDDDVIVENMITTQANMINLLKQNFNTLPIDLVGKTECMNQHNKHCVGNFFKF